MVGCELGRVGLTAVDAERHGLAYGVAELLPLAGAAVAGLLVLGFLVSAFVGSASGAGVAVEGAAVETGPLGSHSASFSMEWSASRSTKKAGSRVVRTRRFFPTSPLSGPAIPAPVQ